MDRDAERCNKAGIRESEGVFKTEKANWLWKSLSRPVAMEVRFGWVGADAGTASGTGLSICFGPMRAHLPDRCPQELRNL